MNEALIAATANNCIKFDSLKKEGSHSLCSELSF